MTQTLMNKAAAVLTMVAVLAAASCSNDEVMEESAIADVVETYNNPHTIPEEEALANLQSFMNEGESNETRSDIGERKIAQIYSVEYHPNTRSGAQVDCEKLVYVANFENEQGFAILAADDRIEEKVIAITDNSSLSSSTINKTMLELTTDIRPLVKGYPLTGEGFLTAEEYPGEVFMNPNTINLYDNNENDTLVGNFLLEDDDELLGGDEEDLTASSPHEIVSALTLSYAILNLEENKISDRMCGSTRSNSNRIETSSSQWSITKNVYPMLGAYKGWHQRTPFNDLYPHRRKFIFLGKKKRAPAGCFPLAIAKILTYHTYPNTFTYNGATVDWSALRTSFNTSIGSKSAAALLRGISIGCNSRYFYSGTFTFPKRAASFMRHVGYNNANLTGYSFSKITSMLDKECPLAICACPNINIFKSHAWNIDGYKVKTRSVTTKKYIGDKLKETTTETETCNMVHCDFGWKGKCNGYFISGVFKLNSPDAEIDNSSLGASSTNYNNFVKIITYSKP